MTKDKLAMWVGLLSAILLCAGGLWYMLAVYWPNQSVSRLLAYSQEANRQDPYAKGEWARRKVVKELGGSARAASALDQYIRATANEATYNHEAIFVLGYCEEAGISPLLELLDDGRSNVRSAAVRAIGLIGSRARIAVPQLLSMLEKAAGEERLAIVSTIALMKETSSTVIPAVAKILADRDAEVRRQCIIILGHVSPTTDEIVRILGNALADPETFLVAATSLAELGSAASAAIPTLEAVALNGDPEVRAVCLDTLRQIRRVSSPSAVDAER